MIYFPENLERICFERKDDLDGYIRYIFTAKEEYMSAVKLSPLWKSSIPFAVSAFGDIFAWDQKDNLILLYKFSDGAVKILMSGSEFYDANIHDAEFQKDFFDLTLYHAAKEKLGILQEKQSYIFVPSPAFGGSKDINSIQIGDTRAYLGWLCAIQQ